MLWIQPELSATPSLRVCRPFLDFVGIGVEFVRQYYTLLVECPEELSRFYAPNSTFVHDGVEAYGLVVLRKMAANSFIGDQGCAGIAWRGVAPRESHHQRGEGSGALQQQRSRAGTFSFSE